MAPGNDNESVGVAPDGLRARRNGRYAVDKLQFLDDYLPPAWKATQRKPGRWYIDLFAGPGWNVDTNQADYDFPGSPYRALTAQFVGPSPVHCTHAVFINKDPLDHAALLTRVNRWCAEGTSLVPRDRIAVIHGDANARLRHVLNRIPIEDYIFVFADILGPKMFPWRTVQLLGARDRSIDLYVLLPHEMGIRRLIAHRMAHTDRNAETLTAFFGTEEWRPIVEARRTDAESRDMWRALVQLYERRLRSCWDYVDEQKRINAVGDRTLYRMLFATRHPVGAKLAGWERASGRKPQISLDL